MKARNIILAMLAALPAASHAEDGWSRLNIHESVTVAATPAQAFAVVSRWDALQSWCSAFVSTEIRSGGTAVGSVRAVTLDNGPTFTEELLALDPQALSYRYRIVESPLPIVDYVSTVKVLEAGGQTHVVWSSSYKRRVKDNPTPEQDDAAMLKLVGGLYKACLANARKVIEGR
jgi:hypothetical protein